jgi:hypothetical protein
LNSKNQVNWVYLLVTKALTMDSFEDKLNRHIDKVLEIQQNKETKPLTLDELKGVDLRDYH